MSFRHLPCVGGPIDGQNKDLYFTETMLVVTVEQVALATAPTVNELWNPLQALVDHIKVSKHVYTLDENGGTPVLKYVGARA